ncbi:MAG TPA: phosphopyruvate hydratase [bacterium]|nr:phosphopyruvate hydratase [bacterium]
MNTNIKNIIAREILDSRSNPTIETEITLDCGLKAKASVPSGASTGVHEALELRDNNKKRYNGHGVLKACANVNKKIANYLKGEDILNQEKIDQLLIKLAGKNKANLGANATLSVSLAVARAATMIKNLELHEYLNSFYSLPVTHYTLPIPTFNIFNGGAHADSNVDIQEFMIIPAGIKKYEDQLRAGSEIFHCLGMVMKKNKLNTNVGNEGGYACHVKTTTQVFDLIITAIKLAGYKPGKEIFLGIDAGSSEFYNKKTKKYNLKLEKKELTAEQLITLYNSWLIKYPLISLEDPLSEDDFAGWSLLNSQNHNLSFVIPAKAGIQKKEKRKKTKFLDPDFHQDDNSDYRLPLLVGDDLFTTNTERLKLGIEKNLANAVIVKPNQIGTLTETFEFIKLARENNYKIIVSHRSGETNDDFIADLAVAVQADFVKFGAPNRGERVAKYNRLLEISLNNFK